MKELEIDEFHNYLKIYFFNRLIVLTTSVTILIL